MQLVINGEMTFSAASIIKIPLVSLLLEKAARGEIDLDEPQQISDANRVGGAGVITLMNERFQPTVKDLAVLTIVLSDNTATNQVIDLVGGTEEVTRYCYSLGMTGTELQRKMMDFAAIEAGRNNLTTPSDIGMILHRLANQTLHSDEVSKGLVDIMKGQQLNLKFPYLIPALEPDDPAINEETVADGTVVVAHKSGELDRIQHDVGIFYLPNGRKYILAVFTSDLNTDLAGISMIAKLSKVIYDNMSLI